MSLLSRLRHTRRLSTTTSKDEARSLLALLKTETDPHKTVSLCKSASLTPDYSQLHRITLSRAVTSLRDSTRPDLIPSILDDLLLSLKTHRSASHAILLYGRVRMPHHAVRTFRRCSSDLGVPQDVELLNTLLSSLISAQDHQQITQIYAEFPKIYGIEPNLTTYNHLIKWFSESGSTANAYAVLEEMEMRKIKPDGCTFVRLLAGFYREERLEDVENVINLMVKFGFQPGVDIYNVRIKSLCKLKKSGEAAALLDGMLGRGMKPNVVTFKHLIRGFSKEGNYEQAKKMFGDMVERGLKPDCNCYYMLVYYLCLGGDFESALWFAKESIGKDWMPKYENMRVLVDGLVSIGKDWMPKYENMRVLVDGLVSIGKVAEARGLIGQMKEKFTVDQDRWSQVEEGLPQ